MFFSGLQLHLKCVVIKIIQESDKAFPIVAIGHCRLVNLLLVFFQLLC